jgi:hypothetical protein
MLRDFNKTLRAINGKDELLQAGKDGQLESVPFAQIVSLSLMIDEDKVDGKTRFTRYKLAQRIIKNADEMVETDISEEEAEIIREAVALKYNSLAVGQLYELLEAK